MTTLGDCSRNTDAGTPPAATRIEVFTNADGDHLAVRVNGRATEGSLFTSKSMDPDNRAVWLDGQRVYDVELHWNGTYQFTVPAESQVDAPASRTNPSA